MRETATTEELLEALSNCVDDDGAFSRSILLTSKILGVDEHDLADWFDVRVSTVRRWLDGEVTSSRVIRKYVRSVIREKLRIFLYDPLNDWN